MVDSEKENQDASEKEDAKNDADEGQDEEPEKKPGILNKILDAVLPKKEEVPEEEIEEEEATPSELIAPQSLIAPAEVVDAYVLLEQDYTQGSGFVVPVSDILEHMRSVEDGSEIVLPEYEKILWTKGAWGNGNRWLDKVLDNPMELSMDGTLTIPKGNQYYKYYDLEFLVGSGEQLDDKAVRYEVRVYTNQGIKEQLEFSIYQENEEREKSGNWKADISEFSSEEFPVTARKFYCNGYDENEKYILKLNSFVADTMKKEIAVKAYHAKDVQGNLTGELLPAVSDITDELFETGYQAKVTEADTLEASGAFTVVYTDPKTNVILGNRTFEVIILPEEDCSVKGQLSVYQNGDMEPVAETAYGDLYSGDTCSWWMKYLRNEDYLGSDEEIYEDDIDFALEKGYTTLSGLYYNMSITKDGVAAIYLGYKNAENGDAYEYPRSIEAAKKFGAKEITKDILDPSEEGMPHGYQLKLEDYSEYHENMSEYEMADLEKEGTFNVTVFFEDGTSYTQFVMIWADDTDEDEELEIEDGPLVKCEDPYFRMETADNISSPYANSFYVKNSPNYTMDTYYGYGYQTVFLRDEGVDLSALRPVFWNDSEMEIHSGGKQESGVSVKNFSNGFVQYVANDGKKKRNYQVSFVKETRQPSLYVFGPDEREVYLTEYFDYRHDILIANLGASQLTEVKVELNDAQNIKLDDYWRVGGTGNDTLGAFSTSALGYAHADMPNLAKIRLVPDGEGEISGTLVISATGQNPVKIKLQGYAEDPQITTDELSDAVKYVPYSYMLATSNIHQEATETYKITDGELPEGLSLNAATGEIYGVPKEAGEFTFTVKVSYSKAEFTPSEKEFTLTVQDNTNQNVHDASDVGYEIKEYLGTETAQGTYDYVVSGQKDELFVSNGLYEEFVGLWLNGEQLVDGVDFTKVSGSTRMTIRSQTFQNKGKSGVNTIAAEFRTGNTKVLKRTAQNFQISEKNQGGNSNNSSQTNAGNRGSSGHDTGSSRSINSWSQENGKWRYKNPDGTYAANEWKQLPYNGTMEWYYFGEDGNMMTGWLVLNGKTYYLNPESDGTQGKMCTGWKLMDGIWYFFNDSADMTQNGAMTTGGWQYLAYNGTSEWYFFNEQGQMQTGWVSDGDKKYYLYPIADGTRGRMLTGWQTIDGKEYYLNEVSDGTKGVLLTNARIGDRYVDRNGVRIR